MGLAVTCAGPALAGPDDQPKSPALDAAAVKAKLVGNTLVGNFGVYWSVLEAHADPGGALKLHIFTKGAIENDDRRETGKWWLDGAKICIKTVNIDFGSSDCFAVHDDAGTVRLVYTACTAVSSNNCKTGRVGFEGKIVTGDAVK
ncbi:hypothetical protein D3874_22810 [Oleomonas cavernae]|uniref:Uncharacterized protein n=1 Tax=Oleomonas cavernae TaxID=2320859 RepID=A0A418WHM7_9PROT|nr:hypothetical protein D3874_22810 [Oleomonas cavernae]